MSQGFQRRTWLMMLGGILLLFAVVLQGLQAYWDVRQTRAQEDAGRAVLIAKTVVARIVYAVDVGIPMHELVGVENFFDQQREAFPEIEALILRDATRTMLWQSSWQAAAAQPRQLVSVEVPVEVKGQTIGYVDLSLRDSSLGGFLFDSVGIVGLVLLAVLVFAWEGLRQAWASGPALRGSIVAHAARSVIRGDFSSIYLGARRQAHDLRPQILARAMRDMNERAERIRRLGESMRETEPERARRTALDRLLTTALGSERFVGMQPAVRRLVPLASQVRWWILLNAVTAEGLCRLFVPFPTPLQAAAGWVCLLIGIAIGRRLAWHLRGYLVVLGLSAGILLAMLTLGVGLFGDLMLALPAPMMAVVAGRSMAGLLLGGMWAVSEGAAVCTATRRDLGAVLDPEGGYAPGWILGMQWLGPVIALWSVPVFNASMTAWLLVAPALLSCLYLTRWTGVASPWQGRIELAQRPRRRRLRLEQGFRAAMAGVWLAYLGAQSPQGLLQAFAPMTVWSAAGLGVLVALRRDISFRYRVWLALAGVIFLSVEAFGGDVADVSMWGTVAGAFLISIAVWSGMLRKSRLSQPVVECMALGALLLCVANFCFGPQALVPCVGGMLAITVLQEKYRAA